ncbi:MAG: DUF371 domain-containing protein [Candidatus Methanomethylicia archaeon]|nr:DUF371 domain-containing protein [Candidatus Methanomethylicia archaeon]MCX8169315.1 DUF371 domain-containing protein [Candidatus Methanomethylicia archaeon]MDW7988902.1 DUF371 domain-containing protein [Nitrososphaerota archaeon]
MLVEEIIAYGHPNIRAIHRSTIEITKESYLTKRGDCIIGIRSNKACADISEDFKKALRNRIMVKVLIKSGDFEDIIIGYGHPGLLLTDNTSIVIRRSNYVCHRTLLINSNKAAYNLNRNLIYFIRHFPEIPIYIKLIIE